MAFDETDLAEKLEDEERPMPNIEHSMLGSRLNRRIGNFVESKGLGEVLDSTLEYRFLGGRSPRYPDVSFIKKEHLPKNVRSYPDIAPDIAIEIYSPNDKSFDVEAKVKEYQKAGVKLVWVIQPYSRAVDVYRLPNGLKLQRYMEDEELDGEDVIPGLSFKVSDIFDYPIPPEETEENLTNK